MAVFSLPGGGECHFLNLLKIAYYFYTVLSLPVEAKPVESAISLRQDLGPRILSIQALANTFNRNLSLEQA